MNDINTPNISTLESLIQGASLAVITAHMRPDGDAVGSCTALYHIFRHYGKRAVVILPNRTPDFLSFLTSTIDKGDLLSFENDREKAENTIKDSDLIFSLDYNAFHRTGEMEHILSESTAKKVMIDHHLNPSRELYDLSFSETQISSTAEYLYHILMEITEFKADAKKLPKISAAALMTGMTTDTNNFANSVFPSTLKMASALLEAGTDRDSIISHLYQEYREERLRLLGELIYNKMKITDYGVAYIILDKETMKRYDLQEGETEGFVNIPLSIGKVRLSCLFKEDPDRIRVSLRSKEGTSANKCAREYFHGGGHEQAAGGKLDIPGDVKSIDEVAGYVEKVTSEFLSK